LIIKNNFTDDKKRNMIGEGLLEDVNDKEDNHELISRRER
jgi:hypothetical protein